MADIVSVGIDIGTSTTQLVIARLTLENRATPFTVPRVSIAGREVLVSVLASQVTSNVPAALLLSGFTQDVQALIVGTNLGGLGTLIASMASLISYRQIAREEPEGKGRYFLLFTASNLVFLAALLGLWALLA